MKSFFTILLLSVTFIFSSCEKEENDSGINGKWYVRTELTQLVNNISQETSVYQYRLYRRNDINSKRFATYSFSNNTLIVERYGRDNDLNKDVILTEEYTYSISNNKIILTGANNTSSTLDLKFFGLGNKAVKLESKSQLNNNSNGFHSQIFKTILIREFPVDDSEDEVFGPDGGNGNPIEVI